MLRDFELANEILKEAETIPLNGGKDPNIQKHRANLHLLLGLEVKVKKLKYINRPHTKRFS